jgi:hypothetical protein
LIVICAKLDRGRFNEAPRVLFDAPNTR